MNTALILHGWGGNSGDNWFPWLEKELNRKLLDVYIPNLPNSINPILDEQLEYISVYISDFKEGGYVIAHSLGCQLTMKFIEENNIQNSQIILVAPSYPGLTGDHDKEAFGNSYEHLEKYFNTVNNFELINTFNNKYYIFLSDNDPYINMENAKKYYKKLNNVEFIEIKNKGHFNVLELEEIVKIIK